MTDMESKSPLQDGTQEDTQEIPTMQESNALQEDEASQALSQAQEALAEANNKHLRLYAEFENFRRRAAREKIDLIETASEGVLKKLLPIVDDFERALAAFQSDQANAEATQEGIKLIYDKLIHLLEQTGVQPMLLEKGTPFDPELHEAVTQVPVEDTTLQGKVVDVVEKGYLLKEKVLRFAKVVTGA